MGSSALSLFRTFGLALMIGASSSLPAAELQVVAPSAPGSSWDQLAQVAKTALAPQPDAPIVTVVNVPGATGTVGLAQFVASSPDSAILVTGLAMLEATVANRSPVGFDQITPLARLSTEPFVVAVSANAGITSVADLASAMRGDPTKVSWAGGPARGLDHVAAILFAKALGLDATRVNYVPFLTSAEAATALAEDKVTAVILSASEIETELKAGRLRALALTVRARTSTATVPTLTELGVPLELSNWRGLAAKKGITAEQRAHLGAFVDAFNASPAWADLLARKGWDSAYLTGSAFTDFLKRDHERVRDALRSAGMWKGPT